MKKLRIFLVGLLIVSTLFALFACNPNVDGNRGREVNAINHRGYGDAPENTLAAFRLSKEKGFDMVECDVCFTKDNQAVLLHDDRVNRTSNGKGRIENLTLQEVKALDFGSWKGKSYVGEKIPTFEEFIELCVELELHPYVEIKDKPSAEQLENLVEIVEVNDIAVTWIARDKHALSYIAELRGEDRFGLVVTIISKNDLQFLSQLAQNVEVFVDADYMFVTQNSIRNCQKFNLPLEVWTINSQSTIENIDSYISGVTSDYLNAQSIFSNL